MAEANLAPVIFSGYLDKESKNSKWNKRFFVLEPGTLRYYKDDPEKLPEEDRQSRGEIKLRRISGVDETTVKDHKSCFELQTSGGPIYLSANTDEDRATWIENLRLALKRTTLQGSQSFDAGSAAVPTGAPGSAKKDTSGYRTKVVGGVIMRIPINTSEAGESSEGCDTETGAIDRTHSSADLKAERVKSVDSNPGISPPPTSSSSSSHHRKDGTRVVKCGYAVKQGNVRKNWKKRFFVLDPFGFAYYHSETEREPIKNIPIQDISSVSPCDTFSDRDNVFQVVTSGRVFYIQCDSPEERSLWVAAVQSELHGAGMAGAASRHNRRSLKL